MFSSLAKDTLSSVFFLAFVFCYIEGLDAIRDKSSLRTSLIVALTISGVFASLDQENNGLRYTAHFACYVFCCERKAL